MSKKIGNCVPSGCGAPFSEGSVVTKIVRFIFALRRHFFCRPRKIILVLFALVFLAACSSRTVYAPVMSVSKPQVPSSGYYRVLRGDTLYSIAWTYAIDYRQLAAFNHLHPPYQLHPGQMLRVSGSLKGGRQSARSKNVVAQRRQAHKSQIINLPSPVRHWRWPARGRLLDHFSEAYLGNAGVDISGHYGEPIRAAANGVVVYSGTGIRGYGNLIIVKHNNSYLSAYAFNKQNLVRRGAKVKAGQVIAKMGRNNAGRVLLHFEIRRDGKPVNPLKYLS